MRRNTLTMLRHTKELFGHTLAALDGDIGSVKDAYFDDKTWVVRYLVADTGSWLTGRLVLLSPHAFARFDPVKKVLHINLTRVQIENSPSIETHRPVSRQFEIDYYRYYGWPSYWTGGLTWGFSGFPDMLAPATTAMAGLSQAQDRGDRHLRSTLAMNGYGIHATDGMIGEVSGLRVDDKSWAVRELSVDAGHWYAGKEIFISPDRITRISYEESKVFVTLTRAEIERTAAHELAGASRHGLGTFTD